MDSNYDNNIEKNCSKIVFNQVIDSYDYAKLISTFFSNLRDKQVMFHVKRSFFLFLL